MASTVLELCVFFSFYWIIFCEINQFICKLYAYYVKHIKKSKSAVSKHFRLKFKKYWVIFFWISNKDWDKDICILHRTWEESEPISSAMQNNGVWIFVWEENFHLGSKVLFRQAANNFLHAAKIQLKLELFLEVCTKISKKWQL